MINSAKAARHKGCSVTLQNACFSGIEGIHATHQIRLTRFHGTTNTKSIVANKTPPTKRPEHFRAPACLIDRTIIA
ncbi:hypothetical protein AB1J88_19530 [Pseudomonas sp. S8]|uniref:hypothetical protein n=1 Tax=Pseudomonas sp. S8 TaxID=211136 RepID=UPI003D264F5B